MIQEERTSRNFKQSQNKLVIIPQPPTNLEELIKNQDSTLLTTQFKKRFKNELYIPAMAVIISKTCRLQKRFIQFLEFSHAVKKKFGKESPTLPAHKQNQLTQSNIAYVADFLLIFLRKVIEIGLDEPEVCNFLEILPQKYGNGIIYAQVPLKKLSGGRHNQATCTRKFKTIICGCCRNWRTRYFTITDECVFYTAHKKNYQIKQMLGFSLHFNIVYGTNLTGNQLGIIIKSAYRNLQLQAQNLYDFIIFISAIKKSLTNSHCCQINRFQSFAPIRTSCFSKYYIDGQNYFSDLRDQLLRAQKTVYITGWMLTPYFLLKRPCELDDRSCRLDYILENIAQRGVKIYIIIYMQPKIALNNDSEFVEYYLEQLHKNIKVLRHPNYILVPFLWSHHQKIIVIDQRCAFMGGLDLCYGRWDNQNHYLYNHNNLWKGADFCNFRTIDIYQPRNFLRSNLDAMIHARMPWHDIAVQIRGASVSDLSRHFVQYWNFVNFQTKFDDRDLLIQAGLRQPSIRKNTAFWKNPFGANAQKQKVMDLKQSMHNQQPTNQQQYYQKFLEPGLKKYIQMPRISRLSLNRNLNDIKQYPKRIINYIKQGQQIMEHKQQRLLIHHYIQSKTKLGQQSHQILRSASMWSIGLQEGRHQSSIYEAYKFLITNAKQFIYIENQFFICHENIICELLAERILYSHKMKQNFKVVIMLPLLPGFEGQVIEDNSAVMRVQLNWQYQTIARGKNSLLSRLSSISQPQHYIKILSLRNHCLLNKTTPVTQILYIHSKLMIVDDYKVILGSANINDRSLLGDRDSQIGILIQEDNLIQVKGRKVSKSAHTLRCQLYRQHFNISYEQAADFHDEQIWELISKKAKNNTVIYRQIFGCYPDDTMKNYRDILTVKANAKLDAYQELNKKIDGFVVQWPIYFLQQQDLTLKPSQKQFFVPLINFT